MHAVPTIEQLPEAWRPLPPPPVTLMTANVTDGWKVDAWRAWDAPDSLVHGESHHAEALVGLTGRPRRNGYLVPIDVVLRREPTNPYDPNAVRVEVQGQHVGYIGRDFAPDVSQAMATCGIESCAFAGLLRGGYDGERSNVGVMVWLDKRISAAPCVDFGSVTCREWQWPPRDDEGCE